MEKKIKVLHIIKSLGRGGAEMLLPETLRLHDTGIFEFHYIYFLPWKDAMVQAIRDHGGRVTCIAAGNNIQLVLKARAVAAYVKEHKIDMIHSHLPWAGIVSRIAGRMAKVPVLYTEHNKQERYHFATRFMNLLTMNWLTRVIAVSEDVEQSIRKHKPGLTSTLQTVLNGVNTEHFAPGKFTADTVRKQYNIPADAPVIGSIAVFRFQKRLDLWLQIAADIRKEIPNAHFVLVGDGPLKQLLVTKCHELGLDSVVHFTGVQTEVRPYLAAFDLYMMSSIFEGLPIALLEAMASGCAVISTDAGGIKEVIRHEQDGLLCGVDEADRLREFAVRLIRNPAERQALQVAGRKRVESVFSMRNMVKELETIYHSHYKR